MHFVCKKTNKNLYYHFVCVENDNYSNVYFQMVEPRYIQEITDLALTYKVLVIFKPLK